MYSHGLANHKAFSNVPLAYQIDSVVLQVADFAFEGALAFDSLLLVASTPESVGLASIYSRGTMQVLNLPSHYQYT